MSNAMTGKDPKTVEISPFTYITKTLLFPVSRLSRLSMLYEVGGLLAFLVTSLAFGVVKQGR